MNRNVKQLPVPRILLRILSNQPKMNQDSRSDIGSCMPAKGKINKKQLLIMKAKCGQTRLLGVTEIGCFHWK